MLDKIKSIAMNILGVDKFDRTDGKVSLTEDQRAKLVDQLGEGFPDKLMAVLEKELADTSAQDQASALKAMMDQIQAENAKKLQAMEQKLNEADAKIAKLSIKPEMDKEERIEGQGAKPGFKINMKHRHNQVAKAMVSGRGNLEMAGTTINVDDIKTEFNEYTSQTDRPVMKALTQPTASMQFMTTVQAIEVWRASKAAISSVVQQFVSKWTPLGSSTFTPIEITNRRHKVNVPITPDEINMSWLSFLYDESMTPEQMPITKYIIEQLIMPKVAENSEMRLIASGVYSTSGLNDADGEAGQATGLSMDGFVTTLIKMYEAKLTTYANVNFINFGTSSLGVPVTSANIQDKMEEFVDAIDEVYQPKNMNIFTSQTVYRQYKRAYRDAFPATKNDDNSDNIDFSAQRIQPLPSMAGYKHFFATPKENFIRLRNINDGASKIFLQTANYDVKVFAEWWEAVGFAFQEALFVYIDALQVINAYRAADDATNLTTYMLTDAGCTSVNSAKLAGYKAAVAAATEDYTLTTLQTMVTTVNAA